MSLQLFIACRIINDGSLSEWRENRNQNVETLLSTCVAAYHYGIVQVNMNH
jgi:hypothetical protein